MLICNVLPGTLDILARQRCVILIAGSSLPITIPIERILSFNKNTVVIDNADRAIWNSGHIYPDSSTDFIGACVLKIEPNGNIFVAENRINEGMVQQAISDRNGFGFHIDSSNNELMNALIMALCELHNRRMAASGPSMMSSISMFPQQMKSQMMTNPSTAQMLQNDPNQPIPHRMPFYVPASNTPQHFVVPQREQFSRPAAFGPSQTKGFPFTQAELRPLPKQQGEPVKIPIPDNLPPFNPTPPTILSDEQREKCFGQFQPMVAQYNQQAGGWEGVVNTKPESPQADQGETTIEAEAQFIPIDPRKETRKETANHISGMINAILSSGNVKGALPINDGPVAAFVNGDGDVILSYSDGSISPAIRPESVGVDEDAVAYEMQDPAHNSDSITPVKKFNPFSPF